MIKVSLKKDGHYLCTHVSRATVEAVGLEQLQDTEGGGNSDVSACQRAWYTCQHVRVFLFLLGLQARPD